MDNFKKCQNCHKTLILSSKRVEQMAKASITTDGYDQGVTKRCLLSWLTNSVAGELRGLSQ
jgi:hypothetical protein